MKINFLMSVGNRIEMNFRRFNENI